MTTGYQPVTVVFDLVNPLWADRRLWSQAPDAGSDIALEGDHEEPPEHAITFGEDRLRRTQAKGSTAQRRGLIYVNVARGTLVFRRGLLQGNSRRLA